MNFPDLKLIPDVQSSADTRQLIIDRVGIRGLKYPMQLVDLTGEPQGTVVEADLSVELAADVKGTHMSRFIGLLEGRQGVLTLEGFQWPAFRHGGAAQRPGRHHRVPFSVFCAQGRPGVRREQPDGLPGGADRRHPRRAGRDHPENRRAGDQPVPVLQGDRGIRRPQPAFAHHHQRALRGTGRDYRTDPDCRDRSLVRTVRPAQAAGRKVRDRTRLRQSQVRRGSGARHRGPPQRGYAHCRLPDRVRKLRIDPQSLRLRDDPEEFRSYA